MPAPRWLFTRDNEDHRDAHRMQPVRDGRYLWAFDRAKNVAEVFESSSGAHLGTIDLRSEGVPDPTPDLSDISPGGNRMFVALRGPNPLSGDPHVSTGSTPGIGIYQLEESVAVRRRWSASPTWTPAVSSAQTRTGSRCVCVDEAAAPAFA